MSLKIGKTCNFVKAEIHFAIINDPTKNNYDFYAYRECLVPPTFDQN